MKGRDSKGGAPSADLLVCFPSRAHLTLMPKPMCSPARRSESAKRHHQNHHHHHHKKPGQASPLLWAQSSSKQMGPESSSEPTSPKVTCAGQIKVRPTTSSSCRNWQSVMEEIERIHNNDKQRKRTTWAETFGFKKEVMQFLTCLRSIRFDFRCFGSFPEHHVATSDDDDDDEAPAADEDESGTVFSKWFMVLQEENQEDGVGRKQRDDGDGDVAVPPANALLLMRCRSAPVQSRVEQRGVKQGSDDSENRGDEERDDDDDDEDEEPQIQKKKKKNRESLEMVMKYDTDFYADIAKETWVVGGLGDSFSRSRSWKR